MRNIRTSIRLFLPVEMSYEETGSGYLQFGENLTYWVCLFPYLRFVLEVSGEPL